jgi:predicted ferric reductase
VTFYKKTDTVAAGVAKGSAAVVNYNIAIMIALVTRSLTTILRKIRVATLLPLNFNIYFHTILGYTTLAAAWVHSLAHLTSFMRTLANMPNLETLNSLLATPLDEVKPYRWWAIQSVPGITGIIALVLMTMMVVFAIKKARQKNFERFWYTHVLWLVIVIVLAFHGISKYLGSPKFYLWAGFPSLVLLVEKIFALIIHLLTRHKIISIEYLDSGVVEMRITKPPSFKFIPGQYARLKIPEISLLQWHPFSFSSSQSDDYISFHISPVGDWTNQLKQIALDLKTKKLLKVPTIFLLGPYGAPSQHYSNFKDIMIISSGVGATPFASIMKDLSYRAKENSENINTKSVDFYWVNRRPSTHKWLTNLFKELQNHEASKSLVKIHMFFTSPHSKYDVRSLLLWRGLEILHNAGREIKGLEYFDFMFWGRPDWDFIFQQKAKEVGKGTVGVFFCGNNFLAKELHQKCLKYSENVVFKFYKEIF